MAALSKRAILAASILAAILVLPARAQLQVGDNVNMNLNGNVSLGYNGGYSNYAASTHGIAAGGNADLSGSYYSPSFLSFDLQPFYNQSRTNSTYQSVFDASGLGANASIFGGSNFPGSVNFSKAYNSEGGFVLPGLGNITTRGNSQNLGIGWGVHIPDYPVISFQFMDSNNAGSVFGTNQESTTHSDAFGVQVSDTLAGFSLNGGYHYDKFHAVTPGFLTSASASSASDSSGNSLNFGVGHNLPLNGSLSTAVSRSVVSSDYTGGNYNATIDSVNGGAGFQPIRNLNLGVNSQYTNNLGGTLFESILGAGGVVPAELLKYSTHSLDINSYANYALPSLHMTFGANADRREQTVAGRSISSNTFNESATYGNEFLGGFVNATAGVTQTSVDTINSPRSLGFFDSLSYTRRIQRWNLSGSLNYSRNTQTALIGYTTSGYGYSAGIGRRIGVYSHWSFNASGSNSVFNNGNGSGSFSQGYSTGLSLKRFSVNAAYARVSGTSIVTPTGLTPVNVPLPIFNPAEVIIFGGKSYSFGAATTPIRGLTLSATYAKMRSNTTGLSAFSQNSNIQMSSMMQYKLRQLWLTGGYLRLVQGISIAGGPPVSSSSFFIGISRWFNFF
jgi:hypothetical protein